MTLTKLVVAISFTPLFAYGCTASEYHADIATQCQGDEIATDSNCVQAADNALVLDPANDERDGITSIGMATENTLDVHGTSAGRGRFRMGVPFLRGVPGVGLVAGRVTGVESMGSDTSRVSFERVTIQDIIPKINVRGRQHVRCRTAPQANGSTAPMELDCQGSEMEPPPPWGTPAYYAQQRETNAARPARPAMRSEGIGASSSPLGVDDCTSTFVDNDNITFKLNRCSFNVEFDLDYTLSWGWALPDKFEVWAEMHTEAEASLLARLSASYEHSDEVKVSIGSPVTFTVAGIPFYISGAIYTGYRIEADGVATFEAGFTYDRTRTAGVGWARGDGLYKIWSKTGDGFQPIGPTVTAEGHMEASGYVRPEIELGMGVDGILSAGVTFGVEVGSTFGADVNADLDQAEICYDLYAYMTPKLGYDLNILWGLYSNSGSFDLATVETQIVNSQCIATNEAAIATCSSTDECNSTADCNAGSMVGNAKVANSLLAPDGAPSGFRWSRDLVCVIPACDTSACTCNYTWDTTCCTVDEQCTSLIRPICDTATNECTVRSPVTHGSDSSGGTTYGDVPELKGFHSSCSTDGTDSATADTSCDDGDDSTTDACESGSCTHTGRTTLMIGGHVIDTCDSDSSCGSGHGSFCSGGTCLSESDVTLEADPCEDKDCNDHLRSTTDACDSGTGECTHTLASTSTVSRIPSF